MRYLIFSSEISEKEALKVLDQPKNTVYLSITAHNEAHAILYVAWGCRGDLLAVLFRSTKSAEEILAIRKANGQIGGLIRANQQKEQGKLVFDPVWQAEHGVGAQKKNKQGFFNSTHQKECAQKGGRANTPAQRAIRIENGKRFAREHGHKYAKQNGKKMGIKNQSPILKEALKKRILWNYANEQTFVTDPQETLMKLIEQLESFIPGAIKDYSNFSKVLRGKKPRAYGWSIVNILES